VQFSDFLETRRTLMSRAIPIQVRDDDVIEAGSIVRHVEIPSTLATTTSLKSNTSQISLYYFLIIDKVNLLNSQ
jgi:hypothetical protein